MTIGYQQSLAAIWTRDLPAAASAGPDAVACRCLFSCHGHGDRSIRAIRCVSKALGCHPRSSRCLVLGPRSGASFSPAEEAPSAEPVVVLSYSMWQQYFGGQADVLGRSLAVDGKPSTIVGVMPQAFQFPDAQTLFWLPYTLDGRMAAGRAHRAAR